VPTWLKFGELNKHHDADNDRGVDGREGATAGTYCRGCCDDSKRSRHGFVILLFTFTFASHISHLFFDAVDAWVVGKDPLRRSVPNLTLRMLNLYLRL
jgi:hypothetical protein